MTATIIISTTIAIINIHLILLNKNIYRCIWIQYNCRHRFLVCWDRSQTDLFLSLLLSEFFFFLASHFLNKILNNIIIFLFPFTFSFFPLGVLILLCNLQTVYFYNSKFMWLMQVTSLVHFVFLQPSAVNIHLYHEINNLMKFNGKYLPTPVLQS